MRTANVNADEVICFLLSSRASCTMSGAEKKWSTLNDVGTESRELCHKLVCPKGRSA